MSLCINPRCPQPDHPSNDGSRFCQGCGTGLVLQGRYRVMRLISDKSGFGRVYEAFERSTPKILKVLKESHALNPKAVELFEQEAAVLGRLNHPGVPAIESDGCFQVLPKDGSPPLYCIIMEKIDGPNLSEWMRQQGNHPISERQALNWLRQLAEILHLVHQQNYFHRDIKPENIMLRSNGQLVLVDFGAAREMTYTYFAQLGATGGITRISSAGYTPPEQERGQAVPQSDFYALGCTFIYLLTTKKPTESEIYDSLNNEFRWRPFAPHISPALADFIDRLTASQAAKRPPHTQAVLNLLDEVFTHSAVSSTGSSGLGAPRIAPLPPLTTSILNGDAVPSSGGHGALSAAATLAQPPATAVQPPELKRWRWGMVGAIATLLVLGSGVVFRDSLRQLVAPSAPTKTYEFALATTLSGHQAPVNVLALAKDQRTLISGSDDRTIKVWNLVDGQKTQTLSQHESPVGALAVSPDGRLLASGGGDRYIQLWDLNTGEVLQTLLGHGSSINDLAITPDGNILVSGSADRTIRLWNLATGEAIATLEGHNSFVNTLAISPDGRLLVSGGADRAIIVWDLTTLEPITTLQGHGSFVNALSISPDGNVLASAGADDQIKLWDLDSFSEIRTLEGHRAFVNALQFTPIGDELVSSSADETIRVWDWRTGELLDTIPWEGTLIDAIAIRLSSPGWQVVAAGKGSSDIQIWQMD
ncbi:MAG: WD40 repeat domain-containing serine/threonine-protein kinase [Synechococcales bacterium]|nr:WD40 repeat domain-containing serine/threonine-protein kinase [Synechococcales bacterium]